MPNLSRIILFALFTCFIFLYSCKSDKTKLADIYITFEYDGPKIDTTTSYPDQLVFRNIDGSPTIYVPTTNQDICENKIHVGTYAIGDTLEWHLRLVEPDGDPQSFKIFINDERELVLINSALHFVLPVATDFTASIKNCKNQQIIRVGN